MFTPGSELDPIDNKITDRSTWTGRQVLRARSVHWSGSTRLTRLAGPGYFMYGGTLPAMVWNSASDSGSLRNAAQASRGGGLPPLAASVP